MDGLISVAVAEALIAEHMPAFASERVPLQRAAGRILRQAVLAERDQPPFDRVMMDGIAIRWRETLPAAFKRVGVQLAGAPIAVLDDTDACIEVTTGAVLPRGCDCVIPVEQTRCGGERYHLREGVAPQRDQFIHCRGNDCVAGAKVLDPGARIGPTAMALLAANGVAQVEVAKVPSIAIIATGDELATVDAVLEEGQIRRSNDFALASALQAHGFDRATSHHVGDDAQRTRELLARLLDENDVLLLSGGVSMGQRDLVPAALEALGVRRVFHRIAQRPGKPMWFGIAPGGRAVFALPGNPVSSLVCAIRYARPALLRAMGLSAALPERVTLAADAETNPALTCFIPVHVHQDASRLWVAQAVESRNSGDFTSLAGTDGVVEVPPGQSVARAGAAVVLHRW